MRPIKYRKTVADIDLNALSYNVNQFKSLLEPSTAFMGVIKANAYGHGAVEIAEHLISEDHVNYLAVAVLDEGIQLREAGIQYPILLLSPLEDENIPTAIKHNLTITVFSQHSAALVKEHAERLEMLANIHLKVETGMTRIGFADKETGLSVLEALDSEYVNVEGIFTHFSDADNVEDSSYTEKQFEKFREIYSFLEEEGYEFKYKHCCNTAATVSFPEYHLDMVRVGIGLYGYHGDQALDDRLDITPIMTFKIYLGYIKTIDEGVSISYGRTFTSDKEMKIGTILAGYADGISRNLSNGWELTISGKKTPIVGRVCMDQTMVDLSGLSDIKIGDYAVLFGNPKNSAPSLYKLSETAGGFHYEMLCNIDERVPKNYKK